MDVTQILTYDDYEVILNLYKMECLKLGYRAETLHWNGHGHLIDYAKIIGLIDHQGNKNKNDIFIVATIDVPDKKPIEFKKFKRFKNTILKAEITSAFRIVFTLEVVNR